jgi:hypothetical protein
MERTPPAWGAQLRPGRTERCVTMPPETPPQCAHLLDTAPARQVRLGCFGIYLLSPEEQNRTTSLYQEHEVWEPQWLVIARDSGLGDPFFLDTQTAGFPVYTGSHEMGEFWSPDQVAPTLRDFLLVLEAIFRIADGRGSPGGLKANPVTEDELRALTHSLRQTVPERAATFGADYVRSCVEAR